MLPFSKAHEAILNSVCVLSSETISIADSLNRILAEDIKSDIDIPACDRAVMDGYWYR